MLIIICKYCSITLINHSISINGQIKILCWPESRENSIIKLWWLKCIFVIVNVNINNNVFVFYDGKQDGYSQIIVTMVKHCDDMWKRDDDGAQYLFVFSLSLGHPDSGTLQNFV